MSNTGHLNWWTSDIDQKLWPLATSGDGNCLLHAASLGIWGIHDRQLNLRNALYEFLRYGVRTSAMTRRWRWQETKNNLQSELVFSEIEWTNEWKKVVEMATTTPRASDSDDTNKDQIYESLENIHIFALAHVLRRPIIVVADTILKNASGEPVSPILFGGIYLPIEFSPEKCQRSPLILCYDASHFSPLVSMRQSFPASSSLLAIPITDRHRRLLPLQFCTDPGPDFTWWKDSEDSRIASEIETLQSDDWRLNLISRYMDIVRTNLRQGSVKKTIPWRTLNGHSELLPEKFMTLNTSGSNETESSGRKSSNRNLGIFQEIRQRLHRLGRKNRRNSSTQLPKFSSEELLQTNSVLCALLHTYQHQNMDSMIRVYIKEAKERFEQSKMNSVPKVTSRMSCSLSDSSNNLTCLNSHCQRTASSTTNFFCEVCFNVYKQELEFGVRSNLITRAGNNPKMNPIRNCQNLTNKNDLPSRSNIPSNPDVTKGTMPNGTNETFWHATKKPIHRQQPSYDSAMSSLTDDDFYNVDDVDNRLAMTNH